MVWIWRKIPRACIVLLDLIVRNRFPTVAMSFAMSIIRSLRYSWLDGNSALLQQISQVVTYFSIQLLRLQDRVSGDVYDRMYVYDVYHSFMKHVVCSCGYGFSDWFDTNRLSQYRITDKLRHSCYIQFVTKYFGLPPFFSNGGLI